MRYFLPVMIVKRSRRGLGVETDSLPYRSDLQIALSCG